MLLLLYTVRYSISTFKKLGVPPRDSGLPLIRAALHTMQSVWPRDYCTFCLISERTLLCLKVPRLRSLVLLIRVELK